MIKFLLVNTNSAARAVHSWDGNWHCKALPRERQGRPVI